jgi:hypothetical protein
LAEQIAEESRSLADDLQTDLNNHCSGLVQNKLCIENNMKKMEQKFKEDNSSNIEFVKVNLSSYILI